MERLAHAGSFFHGQRVHRTPHYAALLAAIEQPEGRQDRFSSRHQQESQAGIRQSARRHFSGTVGLAGPTYIWERYPEELNAIYRKRGKRKYARCQEFRPERLKRFLQNEIIEYNRLNNGKPGFVPFTAHNFRDTAMTKAWDADIDLDRAAIAYGCNRETMKKHYIRKDALVTADAVFEKIHGKAGNGEAPKVDVQPNSENKK